jgi:hypothetical protein
MGSKLYQSGTDSSTGRSDRLLRPNPLLRRARKKRTVWHITCDLKCHDASERIWGNPAHFRGGLMRPSAENAARSAELRCRAGRRDGYRDINDRRAGRDRHTDDNLRNGDERRHDHRVYDAGNGDGDVDRTAGNGRRLAADDERWVHRRIHAATAASSCRTAAGAAADEQQHGHRSSAHDDGHGVSDDTAASDRHDGHEHAGLSVRAGFSRPT